VDAPSWFWPMSLGLVGLLFGSLANVIIWRVPRGESIVSPGSHCPGCGKPIRWYDNVPVVSWLVLRARCRDCGGAISWRYPAVEALSGVLWAAAGVRFGMTAEAAACVVLFYGLLVLTFIDIDTLRLPNPIVGGLAAIGAAGAIVSQLSSLSVVPLVGVARTGLLAQPLAVALLGAMVGAGVTAAIAALYGAARGRTGLGAGDVKLLGAIGLFTGPFVLLTLMLGSVAGAVFGVATAGSSGASIKTLKIPFGPFLAAGAVASVLWGPLLWSWYAAAAGLA
jgi:leader peptidase (prepilin peptidase)/N-methyltransferase